MDAWDKAILCFSKALEINPRFFKARINLYQIFKKVQMLERAKKELEILLEQDIHFPDLHLDLAEIYLKENNWASAMSCLNQAMDNNPGFEKAFLLASVIFEKRGEMARGLDLLKAFKEKNSTCSHEVTLRILELEKKRNGE